MLILYVPNCHARWTPSNIWTLEEEDNSSDYFGSADERFQAFNVKYHCAWKTATLWVWWKECQVYSVGEKGYANEDVWGWKGKGGWRR